MSFVPAVIGGAVRISESNLLGIVVAALAIICFPEKKQGATATDGQRKANCRRLNKFRSFEYEFRDNAEASRASADIIVDVMITNIAIVWGKHELSAALALLVWM